MRIYAAALATAALLAASGATKPVGVPKEDVTEGWDGQKDKAIK